MRAAPKRRVFGSCNCLCVCTAFAACGNDSGARDAASLNDARPDAQDVEQAGMTDAAITPNAAVVDPELPLTK